jgi:eukaryotic-like serine/threonine-protein kinase
LFAVNSEEDPLAGDFSIWRVPVDLQNERASANPIQLAKMDDFIPLDLTVTSDGRRLTVLKSRLHQDVYVLDLERGASNAPRRLTLDNHDSFPVVWSLDSRSIFFDSDRTGKSELFRQGLNDSIPETIASGGADAIDTDPGLGNYTTAGPRTGISPDGVWTLYWEILRGTAPHPPVRLTRQLTKGGPPEEVLQVPYAEAAWADLTCPSKPGTSCVLEERDGADMVFYTLDPLRGKGSQLGRLAIDWVQYNSWQVSPDGSQIAVVNQFQNQIKILTVRTRTWRELNTHPDGGLFETVAWQADGKGFFVSAWAPSAFNLIHVALSGEADMLLTNAHRQWLANPVASPDGKHLAFQAQTWDNNVWLLQNF